MGDVLQHRAPAPVPGHGRPRRDAVQHAAARRSPVGGAQRRGLGLPAGRRQRRGLRGLAAGLGRQAHAGARCDVLVSDDLLQFWVGDELLKTVARTSGGEVRKKRASVPQLNLSVKDQPEKIRQPSTEAGQPHHLRNYPCEGEHSGIGPGDCRLLEREWDGDRPTSPA